MKGSLINLRSVDFKETCHWRFENFLENIYQSKFEWMDQSNWRWPSRFYNQTTFVHDKCKWSIEPSSAWCEIWVNCATQDVNETFENMKMSAYTKQCGASSRSARVIKECHQGLLVRHQKWLNWYRYIPRSSLVAIHKSFLWPYRVTVICLYSFMVSLLT